MSAALNCGSSLSRPLARASSTSLGKSMLKVMVRSPNSEGVPCLGMPSPLMRMTCPGRVTPVRLTVTVWPSRCLKLVSKPSSAARSGIESFMLSVSRLRLNIGLGTDLSLSTTSPGIWPGFCSLSYLNTMSSPSGIPFSMVALSVFSSRLHFSLDSTMTSCCTIMPGPALRCTIFFSFGQAPHSLQRGVCIFFLQFLHTMRRLIVALFSFPTYRSSSVTGSSISMFRPLLLSCRPPPPKNMSKGEPPCSCWCSRPLRAAAMPVWSYSTRFSGSERISYASVISRNFCTAASPPPLLSGWWRTDILR
mmetsp:Transcript_5762/g.14234  ORF Transcript_5762/g.14234 Transcript_5762/m.14234 type:complete len:306 (+) Transcript_5762:364-1281(+)